jgi:hypothetical protein
VPPTVLQALSRSARATLRNAWLAPVGLVVALARFALLLPAQLFALAVLELAASSWASQHGLLGLPAAAAQGLLLALGSTRFLSIVGGLWLCGLLLAWALRVAWLAGALPTLGRDLAGAPPAPVFATGLAYGFARLLPAAVVAFLLEACAALALPAAALGAVLVLRRAQPYVAAPLTAAALAGALLLAFSAAALGDAMLARAALRGEDAPRALARAAVRFARRPAAFLLVALAATLAELLLVGSTRGLAAVAGAGAPHPLVALGPQLMASALALAVAALVELWRLGAAAVLACHVDAAEAAGFRPDGGARLA